MGETCPECGNEVYKPYTYCSSCGWEASGKDKRKAEERYQKEVERKKREEEEFFEQKKKEARKKRREEEKRSGKKARPRSEDDDDDKDDLWDDEEREDNRYRMDYQTGVKYRHDRGARYHSHDRGDYREAGGPTEYAPDRGYRSEDPTRIPCKCGAEIIIRTRKRPVKFQCRRCGAKGVLKGPRKDAAPPPERPRRGIGGPGGAPRTERKPERRAGPPGRGGGYRPGRPKPTTGKCSGCGSLRLEFYDDGSGWCPDCNRRFYWDKEAERRGGGGGRGAGGEDPYRGEYFCRYCDNPLTFIQMYEKWYCDYCRRYM